MQSALLAIILILNYTPDYLLNFVASRPHLYNKFVNSFLAGEFQSLVKSLSDPSEAQSSPAASSSDSSVISEPANSSMPILLKGARNGAGCSTGILPVNSAVSNTPENNGGATTRVETGSNSINAEDSEAPSNEAGSSSGRTVDSQGISHSVQRASMDVVTRLSTNDPADAERVLASCSQGTAATSIVEVREKASAEMTQNEIVPATKINEPQTSRITPLRTASTPTYYQVTPALMANAVGQSFRVYAKPLPQTAADLPLNQTYSKAIRLKYQDSKFKAAPYSIPEHSNHEVVSPTDTASSPELLPVRPRNKKKTASEFLNNNSRSKPIIILPPSTLPIVCPNMVYTGNGSSGAPLQLLQNNLQGKTRQPRKSASKSTNNANSWMTLAVRMASKFPSSQVVSCILHAHYSVKCA